MSDSNNIKTASQALPFETLPPVSLDKFCNESGFSSTTCWRMRKRGWLVTIRIAGRHYVARAEIARFNERAERGEFTLDEKHGVN